MAHPEAHAPLLRLLALASLHMTKELQHALDDAGFGDQRIAHHSVMPHIPSEGIHLVDLAERAGMTKQAMAELVLDLEKLGYLQRSADPDDRRAKLITFTDRGWKAVGVALAALQGMEDDLAARLGPTQVRRLRKTLLEIVPEE